MKNLRWANAQHIGVCYDTPEAVVYVDSGELYQEILAGKYGAVGEPMVVVIQAPKPSNEHAAKHRRELYEKEADPLFFKAQRGEATTEQWQAKIAEIKARYPYYYDEQGNLLEAQA